MEPQPLGVCVLVIRKNKQEILLGKRKNSYRAGMYGVPGGRLELSELLEDCGKRELLEETGLIANTLSYIGTIRELQEEYNFIHFAYTCDDFQGEPRVVEPEKCESWDWYPLDNLPENILPGHKAAIDLYQNPSIPIRDITSSV